MDGLEYMNEICPTTSRGKDPNREDVADAFDDGIAEGYAQAEKDIIASGKRFAETESVLDLMMASVKHEGWMNRPAFENEKPQVDGFDAELNALLKKYEHLPKEQLLECMNFYVDELENQWRDEI